MKDDRIDPSPSVSYRVSHGGQRRSFPRDGDASGRGTLDQQSSTEGVVAERNTRWRHQLHGTQVEMTGSVVDCVNKLTVQASQLNLSKCH